jgi:hypothetical protein
VGLEFYLEFRHKQKLTNKITYRHKMNQYFREFINSWPILLYGIGGIRRQQILDEWVDNSTLILGISKS